MSSGTSSDEDDVPLGAYLQSQPVQPGVSEAPLPLLVTPSARPGSDCEPANESYIRPGRNRHERRLKLRNRQSLLGKDSSSEDEPSSSLSESSDDDTFRVKPNNDAIQVADPAFLPAPDSIVESVQKESLPEPSLPDSDPAVQVQSEQPTQLQSEQPPQLQSEQQHTLQSESTNLPGADVMASLLSGCSPDMRDPLALYFSLSQKHYLSGFIYKKSELGSDGKLQSRHAYGAGQVDQGGEWCKWWAELHGCVLLLWKVPDDVACMTFEPLPETDKIVFMEVSPLSGSIRFIKSCHQHPIFMNVMDAVLQVLPHPYQPYYSIGDVDIPPPPLPYNNYLAFSTAGSNVYLLAAASSVQCNSWASAMTLASFEMRKICELYTYRLLKRPSYSAAWTEMNIQMFKTDSCQHAVLFEGELNIRLTFCSEWRQCYVVVTSSRKLLLEKEAAPEKGFFSKKKKKETVEEADEPEKRGHILIYETQKDVKRNRPLMHAPHISSVHGVWPEKHEMIEMGIASVAKIEGTFFTVPNEQEPIKKKSNKKTAVDPNYSTFGLNPNIVLGGLASLGDMVTGKNANENRPHPEHMHFMAKNSVDMAKWIIAIQAAFQLSSDFSSMERALDDGAVGFVRQEWVPVGVPASPLRPLVDTVEMKQDQVQVKTPESQQQAQPDETFTDPGAVQPQKVSSQETVTEASLNPNTNQKKEESSTDTVETSKVSTEPNADQLKEASSVEPSSEASIQPSTVQTNPVSSPQESQPSLVSKFVSSNVSWGLLFLSAAEVGSIPMHHEPVTSDNPISTDAKTKAKFESLLVEKTKAWREGYLQQWSLTVNQAEAGRKMFERKEVESKVKDLILWLKLLLPENFSLEAQESQILPKAVQDTLSDLEKMDEQGKQDIKSDEAERQLPAPPPILMAVAVSDHGECVWQYRYVDKSYYDSQLKMLQDIISGRSQEEKKNKKKSKMLSRVDFSALGPLPGAVTAEVPADSADANNEENESPTKSEPLESPDDPDESTDEEGSTNESGDVSDGDSEDDQPLALPPGMIMGPDGLLMFAPDEDEDIRAGLYQPDSLLAQRDRELREKGQIKLQGPLVQLNEEEMLLRQMKNMSNQAGPIKHQQGTFMEFDPVNNPYIANSLLATDRAPVAANRLSKEGHIVHVSPTPDMYQPNSLLSQQPEYLSPQDPDMKRITLEPRPDYFGQNSLLAQAKINRDLAQQRQSFVPEGPLLGRIDKDEKKVRLEGGLLGEMNRREKEKEYYKKMGMYQSLQPPRMPPTGFPLLPSVPVSSTALDPALQMQLQLQQMQMHMQMMQMQMGMAAYPNPMMAGTSMASPALPNPMLTRSDMPSDDAQSVVHRSNLREQFLEKERAKERERMNERTEEWSKQLGFKPYPWMVPPTFDSKSFSDGVSDVKDMASGTESGDSGTEDDQPILKPKHRKEASSESEDDKPIVNASRGSQLQQKVIHIPSGSETESTEEGSGSDSDDEPLAKSHGPVPDQMAAMNRMPYPVPPPATLHPAMNPYGHYPNAFGGVSYPMQGMPGYPSYPMPPPQLPGYPVPGYVMPPIPAVRGYPVPGVPGYPMSGMPGYPMPGLPGYPLPSMPLQGFPSQAQPMTIPDGDSDSDDEPILKRK